MHAASFGYALQARGEWAACMDTISSNNELIMPTPSRRALLMKASLGPQQMSIRRSGIPPLLRLAGKFPIFPVNSGSGILLRANSPIWGPRMLKDNYVIALSEMGNPKASSKL